MRGDDLVIINKNTDEVLHELDEDEKIKITNDKQVIHFKQIRKNFLKLYIVFLNKIPYFNLSKSEYKTLMLLLSLLNYGSPILFIDGIPANRTMIANLFNIDYDTLGRHITKLTKYNIIKKEGSAKKSHFYINPFYINFGNQLSDKAIELFKHTI